MHRDYIKVILLSYHVIGFVLSAICSRKTIHRIESYQTHPDLPTEREYCVSAISCPIFQAQYTILRVIIIRHSPVSIPDFPSV